jgi:hypothetical protein
MVEARSTGDAATLTTPVVVVASQFVFHVEKNRHLDPQQPFS